MTARESFRRLLHAEWTKFRTVTGTVGSLLAAAGAIVVIAVIISSGSAGTYDKGSTVDRFRFVHQPLTGDGTVVARVRDQDATHPWAMAGIMLKAEAAGGAPYVSVFVTPGHGTRMQADFTTDLAGDPSGPTPRWLKLTRVGRTVTGYESADGAAWRELGSVTATAFPSTVRAGLFVTSPGLTRMVPMRPAMAKTQPGHASFDAVSLAPTTPQPNTDWTDEEVGRPRADPGKYPPGAGGVFTLSGGDDIKGRSDDGSRVIAATAGTVPAILLVVALGVRAMTAEYSTTMIRTTFIASPRRGRVLAAKALVLGGTVFLVGLVALVLALVLAQPLLERHGFHAPTYPTPSPSDPTVLRVVIGTAVALALLALLGLGVAVITRRSAPALTTVTAAVLVPVIVMPMLPPEAGTLLQRWAPSAGLSVQQVRETDEAFLLPWAGHPWTGLAILAAYTAVALGVGYWLLRRRDT